MGILNNIGTSHPDTISVTTTPREVILHSCPTSTTIEDIWLAIIIGIIIISGLWIIGHYVYKSVASIQNAKFKEQESRQQHELAKQNNEAEIKAKADEFIANQTKEQRKWISAADQIKNEENQIKNEAQRLKIEIGRQDLRLREAEINDKIRKLDKNDDSAKEQIKS